MEQSTYRLAHVNESFFANNCVRHGPDPMRGKVKVKLYVDVREGDVPEATLRFRPSGFSDIGSIGDRDINDPSITRQSYLDAWSLIIAAGYVTEGEDSRFGGPCPKRAVLDTDEPRSTSPETLPAVKAHASEWKDYLRYPGRWHFKNGEAARRYVAIYLFGSSPDWLGEVGICGFSSHCPPDDLRGVEQEAEEHVHNDTDDCYAVLFTWPSAKANELSLRLHGMMCGTNLDFRPACAGCRQSKVKPGKLCSDCMLARHLAAEAGRPWPAPAQSDHERRWGEPPF